MYSGVHHPANFGRVAQRRVEVAQQTQKADPAHKAAAGLFLHGPEAETHDDPVPGTTQQQLPDFLGWHGLEREVAIEGRRAGIGKPGVKVVGAEAAQAQAAGFEYRRNGIFEELGRYHKQKPADPKKEE